MGSKILALEWLVFTLSPVEYGATPMSPTLVGMENFSFYLGLTGVLGTLFIHFRKEKETLPAIPFEWMRSPLFYLFILWLFFNGTVAACDGRSHSPALGFFVHPEVPPETGVPQGAPVQIAAIPPEVPQLDQPLMSDDYRRVELFRRLSLYFIGRNDAAHLPQVLGILEKQMLLEKKIEAALVHDGYNPLRIFEARHEIRGILFNHPTRTLALSESTLDRYLGQIARNGTRQSVPYGRVVRAIRNYDLTL
ncbi:hypothetical protein BVC80_721g1 [Macleaya cordata]|uniref:Uncharacterized protein n=1 Tax=Macleaya cordata TaxID=56857 RepID=A0A200PSH5_MACCD|nr:hypothetical protein BVC80_721g1 [Macleaya cordata]